VLHIKGAYENIRSYWVSCYGCHPELVAWWLFLWLYPNNFIFIFGRERI